MKALYLVLAFLGSLGGAIAALQACVPNGNTALQGYYSMPCSMGGRRTCNCPPPSTCSAGSTKPTGTKYCKYPEGPTCNIRTANGLQCVSNRIEFCSCPAGSTCTVGSTGNTYCTPADAPLPSSITWGEPSTFGGASWAITNNGLTVEFDFTPKDTCGDGDPQGGQATGTLTNTGSVPLLLDFVISGQVTEPNSGYETLYVSLDNVQVGQSAGDDGCLGAVSTSTNPNAIPALLQPGASATIQLTVDSKDGEYDGGYYIINFSITAAS